MATKSNYKFKNKKTSNFPKILLLYILPFITINTFIFFAVTSQPKYTVEILDTNDYKTVEIQINRKSLYPLKSISAILDTSPIELIKESNNKYTAKVTHNGTLEITAINLNGMTKTLYEHIGSIDDTPPIIYGEIVNDLTVNLNLEDNQSGIDFSTIYAISIDGKTLKPDYINEKTSSVIFPYNGHLEIHVKDRVGNESLATFTDDISSINDNENINLEAQ